MESHFVVWPFNKPTPLPAIPIPPSILSLAFHTNPSLLQSVPWLLVTSNVVPSLPILVTMMVAVMRI
jgi:hypothetical protein